MIKSKLIDYALISIISLVVFITLYDLYFTVKRINKLVDSINTELSYIMCKETFINE